MPVPETAADADKELAGYLATLDAPGGTEGRARPPDLSDPAKFHAERGVPVMTECVRHMRRTVPDPEAPGGTRVEKFKIDYDAGMLAKIAANTQARCRDLDAPMLILGHREKGAPERDHPPTAGYMVNTRMGTWLGKPAIVADLYYDAARKAEAGSYPRRSPEVVPEGDGSYIDALALIRNVPENDLGLVTFAREGDADGPFDAPIPAVGDDSSRPNPPQPETTMDDDMIGKIVSAFMTALDARDAKAQADADHPVDKMEAEGSGTNASVPGAVVVRSKEDEKEREEDEEEPMSKKDIDRLRAQDIQSALADRDRKIEAQAVEIRQLQKFRRQESRMGDLATLKNQRFDFDAPGMLEEVADLPEPEYQARLRMVLQYRKLPIGESLIDTAAPNADAYPEDAASRGRIMDHMAKNRIASPAAAWKDMKSKGVR